MTAPERIWIDAWGGNWSPQAGGTQGIEYIRADLAAVQPAQVLETCGKCMGSGYGGHPDSGQLCADCNGNGGVEPQPDPRDEVIARLVGALEMAKVWLDYNGAYDMQGINSAIAAAKVVQHG